MSAPIIGILVLLTGGLWGLVLIRIVREREKRARVEALSFFQSHHRTEDEESKSLEIFYRVGKVLVVPGEKQWVDRKSGSLGHPGDEFFQTFVTNKGKFFLVAGGSALLLFSVGALPPLIALLVALVGLAYPDLQLYNEEHYRNLEITRRLPSSVDLLVLAVEAGMNLVGALKLIAEKESGPVAEELSRVLREVDLGHSRVAALSSLRSRATEKSIRSFANALIQAETLGIGIGPVLREQSDLLRKVRREQAREQAQQIPVKILLPIMVCFVPAIFLIVLGPVGLSFL